MIEIVFTLLIIFTVGVLWPEITFALFLCAGSFKADPRFAELSTLIDPTLAFFFVTLSGIFIQSVRKQLVPVFPSRQLLVPYYIFVFMMIVGLLYTPGSLYGQEKTLRFLVLTSFSLFAPSILFTRQTAFSRFLLTFVFFAIIFSFLSIKSNWYGDALGYSSGLEGSNYLALGRTAGAGVLICLFYYVIPSSHIGKSVTGLTTCFLLFVGVLVSGGRAPFIITLLSIGLTSWFVLSYKHEGVNQQRFKSKLLFVNILMIIASGLGLYYFADRFERIFSRLELLSFHSGGDSFLSRIDLYSSSIEAIFSFPTILIGLGSGGFGFYHSALQQVRGTYSHNIFLETWVELGLFALIAFVSWLYFSIKAINRIPTTAYPLKTTLFAMFIFTLFNALFSGDFNDNRLLFFTIGTILSLQSTFKHSTQ